VSPPSLAVLKVGGSLFDWPELPRRLTAFLDARRTINSGERIVLIAGGGPSADVVREFDQIHRLGDLPSHYLALHALDLTAILLAALLPGSLPVDRIESMREAWNARSIPILAPRQTLIEIDRPGRDPLKASWDVTSDAIAARIAVHLEAQCLVLLKSAPLPSAATRRDAARLGLVDPVLPDVASPLPRVEYLNLRESPQISRLLPP
jgi:5-(aminomethyl)-3-furanmethanol phosphate kinase